MIPLILLAMMGMPRVAWAHPVTLSYIDVRPATEAMPIILTVAIHPHQALLLLGLPHEEGEEESGFGHQIPDLKNHADVIGAYLASHMVVTAHGAPCTWEPTAVDIPDTELGALADGLSMTAPLHCEGSAETLEITSTIFTDTFEGQQTVVRLELPDGFAERLLLDRTTTRGTLDVSEAMLAHVGAPIESVAPPQDGRLTAAGWAILVVMLGIGGGVIYRMNMASPKE